MFDEILRREKTENHNYKKVYFGPNKRALYAPCKKSVWLLQNDILCFIPQMFSTYFSKQLNSNSKIGTEHSAMVNRTTWVDSC